MNQNANKNYYYSLFYPFSNMQVVVAHGKAQHHKRNHKCAGTFSVDSQYMKNSGLIFVTINTLFLLHYQWKVFPQIYGAVPYRIPFVLMLLLILIHMTKI